MTATTCSQEEDALHAGVFDPLRKAFDQVPQTAAEIALAALNERWARKWWQLVGAMAVLFTIFTVATLVLNNVVFKQVAAQETAIGQTQESVRAVKAQLDAANVKLVSIGQAPVPLPDGDVQPNTANSAKLLAAAATASTLASLPPVVFQKPTAAELASAMASYVAANPPPGPSAMQIAEGLASYFAVNPPPPGPQGPPGPGPTSEQIRQAFLGEIAANPQLLCPKGGFYQPKQVLTSDGTVTSYGCFK